jgi:hypothetical protein
LVLRLLLFFFSAHPGELEVTLVLESDENTKSVVRFELSRDKEGVVVCFKAGFAVASPTRVLVFRPASSTQSFREIFVVVRAVVAIVFEVVLKDVVVVGHVSMANCMVTSNDLLD